MKKALLPLLVLVGVLTGITTLAGASPLQQEDVLAPQIIETSPYLGEELLLTQPITLYFDQSMDQASVEAALTIPTEAGQVESLTWSDDKTLVITPAGEWTRDSEFELVLDSTATSAEGASLADAYRLDLKTVGFLLVSTVLPSPEQTDVGGDTLITVIFNRPVVPLVSLEEQAQLPSPIEITPATEGSGEWLNTSIYVFRPSIGLRGGTDYEVTVKEGLTDVTGALLEESYSWTFTTLHPEILDVWPSPAQEAQPLNGTVQVTFSQPMNTETTAQSFSVTNMATSQAVAGDITWEAENRTLVFTPNDLLDLATQYLIRVDSAVATSEYEATLIDGWISSFFTVPYPEIIRTSPEDGNEYAEPYGGFEIFFNAPMDPETLEDKVTVEPTPWRDFDTYYYDYNHSFQLFFDTEPGTTYTITIAAGMADPYGNTISEPMVVTYTTGNYDPEVNLNVPGFVGLYSAYNPTTRLFSTHRNVSRLDMNLYSVDVPTLGALTGAESWDFQNSWYPDADEFIRSWSVRVQSQPNQRRYELLLLSQQGASSGIENIQCVGAPDMLMALGDLGRVSEDDPRPLRVRSLPNLQGEILAEVNPGTQFTVLDGPICADGYIWWNVQTQGEAELNGWVAEGTFDNYFVEVLESPGGEIIEGDIDPNEYPALPPGVYYLEVSAPETSQLGYNPNEHIAVIATVNITLKYSPKQMLAWVTDLGTGLPVADVPVSFYNSNFELLGVINTNSDGLATMATERIPDLYEGSFASVEAEGQFGFASANFDSGIAPWAFSVSAEYEPETQAVYVYTDRPLYRPDQPVYFRGIVRDRDDVSLTIPQNMEDVPVVIYDSQSQVVFEDRLPLTPHGTFSGEFTLDQEASLGYYRIEVPIANRDYRYYGIGFNVGEYVAPEFSVTATPAADEVVQGDTIDVMVESTYFFGGAVSNATILWSVLSADYSFQPTGIEGYYDFTDYNYDSGPGDYYGSHGEEISTGESKTDAEGKFLITIPANLGKRTQSQEYTIEARVVDESDYLVAGRTTVIVHQGQVYVGLRPERYISRAGAEAAVEVLSVGWDSSVVAGQTVEYRIVERFWSSVQQEDELGRTIWTWEVEEKDIENGEGSVNTDENGLGRITFVPTNSGTYKVYATTKDSLGNEIRTATFLWVSGSDYVSWRQQNSDRFDLITDKQNYNIGDTAEILIASPFQGEVTALVTVERGDILQHEVITLETNSQVYELPITKDFAPNVFVSVLIVKGVDENNAYAQFRMGLVQLDVDSRQFEMTVEVTPQLPAEGFVGPGDEVTYNVKTTDSEGNPVSAEVGIGVTDLSVLSIASPNSGPLKDYFYSQRSVSVRTSTALTISVDRTTQTIIDTIKGGGGGGDEAGIFDIRQEFVDTPGWEPSLVTDENGEGTYTLTLPDNLTVWRLDARAITDGTDGPMLVGQTTTDVQSTKPLLIRTLTPRFLIVDDVVIMGAIVNNNTDEEQVVEISMEGTGFTLAEGAALTQIVTIPAKGRQRVNWEVTILDVESVDVTFYAKNEDATYTDASKPTATQGDPLPVYRYETPETVGTSGFLTEAGAQSEGISLPRRFEVERGTLTIEVDRSLAAATADGLDYLKNFEHQCIEQTVSRFLPNVITARALTQLGLFDPTLKANLDAQVNFGIQRLYSSQNIDGGWGWFPSSTYSNIYVTSYALLGLTEARTSGYTIDQSVVNDAADYLQNWVDDRAGYDEGYILDQQAFVVYVLANAGFFEPSSASLLYNARLKLNVDARAFLALALQKMNSGDSRLATLRDDLLSMLVLSSTGASWEDGYNPYTWTTNIRTTAIGLKAILALDPTNELIPQIVRWLMVARTAGVWTTTQETAWSVMSLTDWMVVTGDLRPDYNFSVALNGDALAQDLTASAENATESETLTVEVADLLADEVNRVTFLRTEGDGNLYYTAHLEAYLPVAEIDPVSRGIILDRKYYLIDPENRQLTDEEELDRQAVTSAMAGDELEVVLTIIVPHDLYYAVIEDPIPAGAGAIDSSLLTSSVLSDDSFTGDTFYGWWWYWYSHREFRDEKVVLYADFLPAGTYEYRYELRLGLPGTFNVLPPTGNEFYFPEVYGRGAGSTFTILAQPEEESSEE